jgi:hypothetical protein
MARKKYIKKTTRQKALAGPTAQPSLEFVRRDDTDRSRSEDFSGLKPASFWK